ncbi:hypothetical protein HmCmsJML134_00123 [Escherichia coli]|uniref:hypothetical protein n=1 Tax=Escherichia coli TaxID=562 RepID=UPI0010CB841C|nr:hypothetical protein [Escherichia coli]EHS7019667.1 hypothetical protein [Escherichia coli]GDB17604.1 hypothetical protein HmCmsJML134_00123 [Escherichia coli]
MVELNSVAFHKKQGGVVVGYLDNGDRVPVQKGFFHVAATVEMKGAVFVCVDDVSHFTIFPLSEQKS